jgi:phage baseplate assembly protein W
MPFLVPTPPAPELGSTSPNPAQLGEIPHIVAPFALNRLTGKPGIADQDSPLDVASCVVNIVSCPKGAHPTDPDFGIDPLLFQTVPIDTAAIIDAVQQQEPRLRALAVEQQLSLVDYSVTLALTGDIASD